MFALHHWRHSPDVVDVPVPPPEGRSLLQRAAYDKDRRAVDALCFPVCDWAALVAAFDSAANDIVLRRGIAAVLCRLLSVVGPVHETPEPLVRWISSTLQRPGQDALVCVLLNACVPFFVPRVVQEPTSAGAGWVWSADAKSFAAQLAAFDERLVRRLRPEALFDGGGTNNGCMWDAEQLRLKLPGWVATQILQQPPLASQTILFFLRAARHLLALGAFNAFATLMVGLTHPAVVRVAPAWTALLSDYGGAWDELLKVRVLLAKLAFDYTAHAAATPYVHAFQVAAVRDPERASQTTVAFLKAQARCTFGYELFDTASAHFTALLPRLDEHALGAASLAAYPEPASSGMTDSLRRWWSGTAPAAAPAGPPFFLSASDWEAVFAKARVLTFGPSAFADQSEPLSVYRVKRGRLGPHVEGEIFCEWSESLLCGDAGADVQAVRLTQVSSDAVRLRALKAYCYARAHRDAEMAPAPPLLREADLASRWTRVRILHRGDVVVRAGQVVDGAYFSDGKCTLGCFVPHATVRADVVALEDEVRVVFVPMVYLDASVRLSTIVFEHLAMQAYLAMGAE